jgi:hypothetical protein
MSRLKSDGLPIRFGYGVDHISFSTIQPLVFCAPGSVWMEDWTWYSPRIAISATTVDDWRSPNRLDFRRICCFRITYFYYFSKNRVCYLPWLVIVKLASWDSRVNLGRWLATLTLRPTVQTIRDWTFYWEIIYLVSLMLSSMNTYEVLCTQ